MAPTAKRVRRTGSHQDTRSFLIAGILAAVVAAGVAAIWFVVKPFPQAPAGAVAQAAPTARDLEAKKTHSYWKVGQETYRHYITDTSTGEIVDAGTVTVREMLDQGISVPGYDSRQLGDSQASGSSSNGSELAVRFRAIQDHLK